MRGLLFYTLCLCFCACSKHQGRNPSLAYSDKALLDSCKNQALVYYGNATTLIPSKGPHGSHYLRFNTIAANALGTDGKLVQGKTMPEGAMIVKDIHVNGRLDLYALMYKRSGAWLWAELKPDGSIQHSVNGQAAVCTGCHSGSGNRDQILSFN